MALKDTYYTVSEAVKKFGITRQTIYRWIASGELSAEKVGRETLIKKREISRYIDERQLTRIADGIIKGVIERVREKYNYTDEDKLEFIKFNKEKAIIKLSITMKDNSQETVTVSMGNPEPIGDKDKSNLYFGFKIPIKKIERRMSK